MIEKHAEIFATNFLKNSVIGSLDIKNYILADWSHSIFVSCTLPFNSKDCVLVLYETFLDT